MRARRGFDATLVVLAIIAVTLLALELSAGLPWRYAVAAVVGVAGVAACYLLLYRPILGTTVSRPWWAVAALAVSCGVATWGLASFMPIAVGAFVMIWATARRVWTSIVSSFVVAACSTGGALLGLLDAPSPLGWVFYVVVGAISYMCAIGYGFWIRQWRSNAEAHQRLVEELRRTQEHLAETSRHAGALEERARVSRDLHDTITQSISAIVLVTTQAKHLVAAGHDVEPTLTNLERMAREALGDARSVVAELAVAESSGDARQSVSGVVSRFVRESAIAVDAELASVVVCPETELALVRCTQEGLANVRKHARASRARVVLDVEDGRLRLTVIDDGVGPGAGRSDGFGLRGMRDRVGLLDGTVAFAADPGGGSRLTVSLPGVRTAP